MRFLYFPTPLGQMIAAGDDQTLQLLAFADRCARPSAAIEGENALLRTFGQELEAYFARRLQRFETPLAPKGTPFQVRVWNALRAIPYGETRSYSQIAQAIGQPTAYRAVAMANGANPLSIVIPCHRVIHANGGLSGYGGGVERKQQLLDLESAWK